MARVFQVDQVSISIQKTNPLTLLVTAAGKTGTPGWKHLDLVSMETTLSADGILDLEFVGDPPTGIVPAVITTLSADFMTQTDVDRIVGVLVHARSNSMSGFVNLQATQNFNAVLGNVFPGRGGQLTTLAVGEENATTFAFDFDEEGKTFNNGEEGKTMNNGEEGKTMNNGEEGKTMTAGEEGTTFLRGEESTPGTGESDVPKMGEKAADGEHNEGMLADQGRPASHFLSPFGRR